MSTISDVARAAGVSVATVSRALRGVSTVSSQTRERVLKAADELHYVASPMAASLASGRTRVIGLVTPFLTRWFFATAVSAVEKALREFDFHVLLIDLEADSMLERRALTNKMLSKRVDGLITINVPIRPEELTLLERLGLPVVAIGNPVPGHPLVHIDDALAVRTGLDHLVNLGHTRIGYAGAVPARAEHRLVPRQRLTGFRDGMTEHGLAIQESWVMSCDWSAQGAARRASELFATDNVPTAIMCGSDEMAIGVMSEAISAGLRVPEDLSVVGVDDYYLSDVVRLTTVRQDVIAQGEAAATTLLHTLLATSTGSAPDLPSGMSEDQVLTVPTTLVRRGTASRIRSGTGAPASFLGSPTEH